MASVAPAAEPTPAAGAEDLVTLGKWTLNFRLITVALASLAMVVGEPSPALPVVLGAAAALNLAALFLWHRLAPWLARHPFALIVDLSVTLGVLLLTGIDGPLLYYPLGTGFLAGVLYGRGGGLAYSLMVLACYGFVAAWWAPLRQQPLGFHELVAVPALLIMAALGATAVRSLLLQRAAQQEELGLARAEAAVSQDRAHLARELHDTLGKTLHGIALSASALSQWAVRSPERAAEEARQVAASAEQAAREARDLLTTLRTHHLDRPLAQALEDLVGAWEAKVDGVDVDVRADDVRPLPPEVRHELLSITSEALRNVGRHAKASHVTVELGQQPDGPVRLAVEDDGAGVALPEGRETIRQLADRGHYGLVGIAERAERAGGRADFRSGPGQGFALSVTLPAGAAQQPPTEVART